jgi:hypothetical protein
LLLRANPNTFDAAVHPAVFALRKGEPEDGHSFTYIDASEMDIQQYRSLLTESTNRNEASKRVVPLDLPRPAQGYYVETSIYQQTLRNAFFEPNAANLSLHDQFMSRINTLVEEWEAEIRDSKTLENNAERIRKEHLEDLSTGDVSILGLLTLGGQGLATDKNAKYMAFLKGSEEAELLADRNPDFEYNTRNENAYKYLDTVITQDRVAEASTLSDDERLNGISGPRAETWVPIEKGFTKSETYFKPNPEYIKWSTDAHRELKNNSGAYLKNLDYNFKPGVFISVGGFANLRARYTEGRVIDHTGTILTPSDSAPVSAKYLVGILNSDVPIHITENFINSSGMETSDLRLIPVPVPTDEERETIEQLVEEAIDARSGTTSASVDSIEKRIEDTVEDVYRVDLDE